MAAENIIERSFAGGEITPAMYARVDQSRYQTGLRTLRNRIVMRHGGATQRPGSMYVGTTLNGGNAVRLIPFIYNETGLGQSYVLEFGNMYIAFIQNGGYLLNNGAPYIITSPYAQADLPNLEFDQCADIVTITNQNYPIQELKRVNPLNWTIGPIVVGPSIGTINLTTFTAMGTGGGFFLYYAVAAVNAQGEEGIVNGKQFAGLALSSATTPVNLSWVAVPNAVTYRVYNYGLAGNVTAYGYIGTTGNTSFTDAGTTPDYNNGPVIQINPFANTPNNPLGFWGSTPGDFYNFNVHPLSQDDDAILSSVAGQEVNAIQHITELKYMLMLTAGAELFVQGNGSGVVTPSAINASAQSQYGAGPLRPLKVGDILLFVQALGSFIRDFVFDFVIDGYRGNDITLFSSHLFEGYQIVDWAYQKVPDSIIWAVRSDGVLLSCTYLREQQVLAWARHDFTNGFVENVCAIPENGQYAVYVVVRRVINGLTLRYIERISSRIWTDPINASYLDCYSTYDGRNTGSTTMTLTASGGFQSGTGTEYQQLLTLTSNTPYFGSGQTAQIGDAIFLQDALFVSSQGSEGNQIRCSIQAITSNTVATVTPNRAVPTEFQAIATTNWVRAVKSLSGLGYLQGQQVSVWADRYVVGSPLNPQVEQSYTISPTGTLTLDKCYGVIYVGLPMVADFETLAIDTTFGDSMLGETKNISEVIVYLYNTRSFFGGTRNPDTDPDNIVNGIVQNPLFNLTENKAQANRQTYDAPPSLITGAAFTSVNCNWSEEGRIFVRNVDPIPSTILAVVPAGLTSAKIPYSQRV